MKMATRRRCCVLLPNVTASMIAVLFLNGIASSSGILARTYRSTLTRQQLRQVYEQSKLACAEMGHSGAIVTFDKVTAQDRKILDAIGNSETTAERLARGLSMPSPPLTFSLVDAMLVEDAIVPALMRLLDEEQSFSTFSTAPHVSPTAGIALIEANCKIHLGAVRQKVKSECSCLY
uniref:Uncharacterized protein n=1 Tax=Chrysotila carterae TaxID=13221 RepID=A0A7S4BAT0_CHRCT